MAFELPQLPYSKNALAPHISADTLEYHHGKHHAAYVKKLNELLGESKDGKSLEEIIKSAKPGPLFNNAAQHWNHSFYWKCMSPDGGKPTGKLADAITKSFQSLDKLKEQFNEAAAAHFGSGWAWLVMADGKLKIETTHDAALPLANGGIAVMTCDVWEHAYYIDYRNARAKYLESFWNVVNWDFACVNYENALVGRFSAVDDLRSGPSA
jgi:Fe-Mn family superoxide dismutase